MKNSPLKLAPPLSSTPFLRYSSSSTHSNNNTTSSLPPKPTIDYNRIISNRTAFAKNLSDRKSHLTDDAIEDVSYLYIEFKNLSKKLIEAKQRQNSLGNKIKEAISLPNNLIKEGQQKQLTNQQQKQQLTQQFPSKEDQELLLSPGPLSEKKTNQLIQSSSNLELAAKVNDYHTEAASLKDAISNLSKDGTTLEQRLLELATQLPNESHPGVPVGSYEHSEIVSISPGSKLATDSLPFQSFQVPCRTPELNRDHLKVMTELGWLSFSDGQKTTGPSFPFLVGNGAFLELALTQYAIQIAVRNGWTFTIGPDIVRSELADRCGFSPRDGGESNHTYFVSTNKANQTNPITEPPPMDQTPTLCLAATAEIPLIGSHHSMTLPNKTYPTFPLNPIQLVSLGTAFRAEAGSRGSESRGLYRIHQFKKVELVAITDSNPQISEKILQKMLLLQTQILSGLNLPYRILEMSTEELGASAYHKYDIEVWMPGRGRWGEVSSASNCTDYQSRRLGIRSRARPQASTSAPLEQRVDVTKEEQQEPKVSAENTPTLKKSSQEKATFVHTLNATAAAIPRLIVGLVENGVVLDDNNAPKAVQLPDSLKPHWLGDSHAIEWIPSSAHPH